MLSVVADRTDSSRLLVRARRAGDIEEVFPGAEVQETPRADYGWRASLSRSEVSAAIAAQLDGIDYPNFKDSVTDEERHTAYLEVWTAMFGYQARGRRRRYGVGGS